jgi:hypothetical protein
MVSFLEKLIEADCGERRRPLSQVGESHWILVLREYVFSAWSSDWRGFGAQARLFVYAKYFSDFYISYRKAS